MEPYIYSSLLALIFAISTAILGYKGYYNRYEKLLNAVFIALKDGKISQDDVKDVITAYNDCKKG